MDPRTSQMESTLALLGKAHREGAFSGVAARYPWRTAEPGAGGLTHRRFAWARVAVPLAAAAAVAVLFVGPALWNPPAAPELAENAAVIGDVQKPEPPAVNASVTTTTETVDCDYNGDGRFDGRDIQAFWDNGGGTPDEVERLQQCLLGQ